MTDTLGALTVGGVEDLRGGGAQGSRARAQPQGPGLAPRASQVMPLLVSL